MRPARARARAAAALLSFAASLAASASALSRTPQDSDDELGPLRGSEGALDNRSFLPAHERASAALAAADRRIGELLGKPVDASTERGWNEVFDRWHEALRDSPSGAMVAPEPRDAAAPAESPWRDADGTSSAEIDRRRDGVESAVLRRLAAISADARAAWRARFDRAAGDARTAAGADVPSLAALERAFPATRAACAAAIALAEHELERARPDAARTWLRRARAHVQRLDGSAKDLESAVQRREALIVAELAALAPEDDEAWRVATRIQPVGQMLIDDRALRLPRLEPGLGVRPGMCFLDGGRAAVQVAAGSGRGSSSPDGERLVVVDLADATPIAVTSPVKLLESLGVLVGDLERPLEPPGWPLLPASDGRAIVATLGRRAEERPNALVCIDLRGGSSGSEPATLAIRWAWQGSRRVLGPGDLSGSDSALAIESARVEFQPGPVVRGSDVFVTLRELVTAAEGADGVALGDAGEEIRTWAAAFDLATGALRWLTELGKGVEVRPLRARFLPALTPPASAQPPAWIDGRVLAASHTGFASLLDGADGRIAYALRCRRRDGESRSWSGGRPPADPEGPSFAWAPADSDHVYWLRGEPDLDGRGVMLHAPRRIGEAEILLGGDRDEALVLTRAGAERTLASWNGATGRSYAAPRLGPSETFSGEGLASAERAWFASTRGLYLLDRTRELYLLDYAPLTFQVRPNSSAPVPGGSVFATGSRVCVLGASTLWVFEARP